MRILIVCSRRTGNTRKIAGAIFDVLPQPKENYRVEDALHPDLYDLLLGEAGSG